MKRRTYAVKIFSTGRDLKPLSMKILIIFFICYDTRKNVKLYRVYVAVKRRKCINVGRAIIAIMYIVEFLFFGDDIGGRRNFINAL